MPGGTQLLPQLLHLCRILGWFVAALAAGVRPCVRHDRVVLELPQNSGHRSAVGGPWPERHALTRRTATGRGAGSGFRGRHLKRVAVRLLCYMLGV